MYLPGYTRSPSHSTRRGVATSPANRRSGTTFGTAPTATVCGRISVSNTKVLAAAWDHPRRRWRVTTNRGELTCDVLITGTGALSEPNIPNIPGLTAFQGALFHSARWNRDYNLRDRRVAVVGTGASAIQFVPRIAPEVASLTLFQRTAPWIMPRGEREFSRFEQELYRAAPALQRLARVGIYCGREALVPGFTVSPRLLKVAELIARAHLRRQVPDPALRARRPRTTPSAASAS